MAEAEKVVSLAERLKTRREELGISQSQAARELDVARTAYRLWEMEAAKPAPDRWRLIASWLGVSVTTMLLAEDLVSPEEASMADLAAPAFAQSGRDWEAIGAPQTGDFFAQARALIDDGARSGHVTVEQAAALRLVLERVQGERQLTDTEGWGAAELLRTFPATSEAPRAARDAVAFVAQDIPQQELQTARLLVSELVTNSVRHGPREGSATVEIHVTVARLVLRVEVADGSSLSALPRTPTDEGGYGLVLVSAMASRWGAGLQDGRNVTWFEIDLPLPGAASAH